VAEGEVGEVVVTTFNPDYPLIRFGTGDLSAVLPGISPCGRSNTRIKGWMGRADQTTKVKGMFVHPGAGGGGAQASPGDRPGASGGGRTPTHTDRMTLHCESGGAGIEAAIAESVREITKLRAEVRLVAAGSLPNDGKVIEDSRKYD
jgi:phenylacetate-CoA ligase